jgi:integrase
VYGSTKTIAQEELRKLQNDHALGRLAESDHCTVADYLTTWLAQTARVKVAPSTLDRYQLIVAKQLRPHLGAVRLAKLTTYQVSQLDAMLEKAGASPRTRQMALTVLGTALRDAVRKRLLPFNPCADAAKPRPSKKEMKVWDVGQVRRFLSAAEADRLHALYVLALDSGMRQGELFGLHWPDVDFEACAIQVQRALSELRGAFTLKAPKTEAGRRRLDVSRFALDALHAHRKRMLAEGRDVKAGLVFCDEAGGFLRKSNVTRRSFRVAVRRANEKDAADVLPTIRFHDMRHTAASLLLASGENVKVLSERLGHEDIEITLKHYAHVMPGQQRGAAEKMERIFTAGASC